MTISNLRYPRANCQYPRADIQCRRADFHCRRVDPYLFVRVLIEVLMCDATVSIIRSSLIGTDSTFSRVRVISRTDPRVDGKGHSCVVVMFLVAISHTI